MRLKYCGGKECLPIGRRPHPRVCPECGCDSDLFLMQTRSRSTHWDFAECRSCGYIASARHIFPHWHPPFEVSERGTAEWWPGIVCDFLVEIGLLGEARWWDDEYKDLRLHIETAMRQARGEEVVADEQIRRR